MKPSPSQMLMDSGSLVNSLIHWLLNTVHLAAGITDQNTGTSECSLHWRAQDSKYRLPLFSGICFDNDCSKGAFYLTLTTYPHEFAHDWTNANILDTSYMTMCRLSTEQPTSFCPCQLLKKLPDISILETL